MVFVWSAGSKLRSRSAFMEFAWSLRPLVRRVRPTAVALVAAELTVAPALVVLPVWGLCAACALLLVLTAGVVVIVRRRLTVRCRCFGAAGQLGVRHLVRNLVLLGVGAAGLAGTAMHADARVAWPGVVLAGGFGIVLSTLVIRYEDVIELVR